MKKRFLKVSFFCLLMACMPAIFTSCKDYDDDIAVLTEQTGSLQSQVNTLEEALNANKEAAAQAAQAAADAMTAAKAAQATADEALAAAKAAQATGDEALALAKSNEAAVAAAQADALNALAAAELAKEAAATAKAEAIAEVMEQVKALMEEQRVATEKELAEIAGQIEGIEKGLNELSGALEGVNGELEGVKNEINVVANELTKLEQAVEVQKAAFEEFQTLINGKIETIEANYADLLETVQGLETSVANLQAADEAIKGDIADVKASVQANATAIAEINTRIDEINTKLDALDKKIDDVKNQAFGYTDAEVAELKAELMGIIKEMDDKISNLSYALNTLSTVFADRLTSITLMPDAYVDGIPCIDFTTATFHEMTQGATADDWYVADGAKTMYITPDVLPISYRLSPKSVNQNTILENGVAFVEKTASILTRGAEDDCILEVKDFKVENGVLVVNAAKNRKAAINKTEDGKINIAALRVNQKATKENGVTIEGAEVYSEYARVTEGYYTPTLAAIADPENHLWTKTEVAGTKFASVAYNAEDKLNLKNLISVCRVLNGKHSIIEDTTSYNLSIDFALAEMNTAVYSEIKDGVITPGAMVDGEFVAAHPTAAYKSQIYRATLKHAGKVVDVKFVEVYFNPKAEELLPADFDPKVTTLSCHPEVDYTFEVARDEFFSEVLQNKFIHVATYDEFKELYNEPTVEFSGLAKPEGLVYNFDYSGDNYPVWVISFPEGIPADVFPLVVEGNNTIKITFTAEPKDPFNYPKVVAKSSLTINFPSDYLSKMVARNQAYWKDATTLRVLPIHKGTANPATGQVLDKCEYYFPVFQAFMEQPVVKNDALEECAAWDFRFSTEQEDEYFATKAQDGINNVNSYVFANTLGEAAIIRWPNVGNGEHYVWDETSVEGHNAYITLRNGDAAKALLNQGVNANVEFVAKYPNGQVLPVQSYVLEFVKPLIIEPFELNDSFKDGVLAGDEGSIIDTDREFVMTDFRGEPVAKALSNGLYSYYGVEEVVWHVEDARVGITPNGAVLSKEQMLTKDGEINANITTVIGQSINADMSLTHNGSQLIYQNTGGLNVEKDFYIALYVTVKHMWGEFKAPVIIPVTVGNINQ